MAGPTQAETFRLRYQAVILGVVTLGEASYEIAENPTRYAARASLRTSGAARIFDQTNISAVSTGVVGGNTIQWSSYDLTHSYSTKFRRTAMRRAANGIAVDINPVFRDLGEPPASTSQQMASLDPLTGIFSLGRSVGGSRACRGSVIIFDGRGHYRLSVSPRDGPTTFSGGGYSGAVVACTFRYQPISGFRMSAAQRARIPEGEAIFALTGQSGFAPMLRLTVPTPVGPAQLDLRGYERR